MIEYEFGEQMPQWYQFCREQTLAYLAYRTILPTFVVPGSFSMRSLGSRSMIELLRRESTDEKHRDEGRTTAVDFIRKSSVTNSHSRPASRG